LSDLLKHLHGKSPDVKHLSTAYGLSLLAVAFIWFTNPTQLNLIQSIIFLLLALDVVGGVTVNLTPSTKSFWRARSRSARLLFLSVHLLQPFIVFYFFHLPLSLMAMLFGYMLTAGVALEYTSIAMSRILSSAFVLFGLLLFQYLGIPNEWIWFVCAYLIKLLFSFSLKY